MLSCPLIFVPPMSVIMLEHLSLIHISDAVRDYTVEMTTMPEFNETEEISGGAGDAAFASHKHRYQGRKKWKVHNALQMGEKVILLRCDGGQQYIVLGRWEARS